MDRTAPAGPVPDRDGSHGLTAQPVACFARLLPFNHFSSLAGIRWWRAAESKKDGRRRRGGRAPVDRGGGVHDWGNRDGVAAALIHPHALAPLLHRRARPAVVALPHPPRQSVALSPPNVSFSSFAAIGVRCCLLAANTRSEAEGGDVLGTG
jgi:hypothetical protein